MPRKVLKKINNKTVLQHVVDSVKCSEKVDAVVIAAPHPIPGFKVFIPTKETKETDVLSRYYQCAKEYGAEVVVRITADCPMVDPYWIDFCLDVLRWGKYAYVSNRPYAPDGLDVEVFTMYALEQANKRATKPYDREHVTPYIREYFRMAEVSGINSYQDVKVSIDTIEDLKRVRRIMRGL